MGGKKREAKDSKKKRSSYKHGLGRKNWKQIDPKKTPHLEWDGKNGRQIDKKKGGILNGTEKMGSKELQEKTAILQTWTGKKKWEANRSKTKPAS